MDFIYPPACLYCSRELTDNDHSFCEQCLSNLKPRLTNECTRCGAPAGQFVDLTNGCGQCRKESFAFDRVIRLGIYNDSMRVACLKAKAKGGRTICRGLAGVMIRQRGSLFKELGIELVAPIPQHWTRRVFHSHYAAETLSREISRGLGVRWKRTLLIKRRRTPKQATSQPVQRRLQQQGSFGVNSRFDVNGKTVLLVDDILTTGSTASAAARVLKHAGAKRVVVAVIAVSPKRK